jgi:predicted RND superfamily exporter protein
MERAMHNRPFHCETKKRFFRRLRLELFSLLICVMVGVAVGLTSGAGHLSAETITGITVCALFLLLAVTDRLLKK